MRQVQDRYRDEVFDRQNSLPEEALPQASESLSRGMAIIYLCSLSCFQAILLTFVDWKHLPSELITAWKKSDASPLHPHSAPSIPSPMQLTDSQPRSTPKVAIPRLRRDSEDQLVSKAAVTGDRHRVTHACESCRGRKTKCSGDRPVCRHCQDHRLLCVYEGGKRDRVKMYEDGKRDRVKK